MNSINAQNVLSVQCLRPWSVCMFVSNVRDGLGGGGGISITGKTPLIIVDGNMNAIRYRDEILTPVVFPYLRTLGAGAIMQDDNARPHRARIITDHLQPIVWTVWSGPRAVRTSIP